MKSFNTKSDYEKALAEIANYFCDKTPKEVSFSDADTYEYEIYSIAKSWNKAFPNNPFEKTFPFIDKLWKTLGSWNYEDNWDQEKCEQIIELAKNHLVSQKAQ